MKKIVKLMLCISMFFSVLYCKGSDFKVNGIYYSVISLHDMTCRVERATPNVYTGSIGIPGSVYFEGRELVVKEIAEFAFINCTKLTSIGIADSISKIGERAFQGCTALETCKLPKYITEISDSCFMGCTNLQSIEIPKTVTVLGNGAFSFCKSLNSVNIPANVTKIGEDAFYGCDKLNKITLPEGLTKIGSGVFGRCKNLNEISLPFSVNIIGPSAFTDCTSLTEITIPYNVKEIQNGTFARCSQLRYIHLSENVTKIGDYSFQGCTNLDNFRFPEGLTEIGFSAFSNCNSLTAISIPGNVKTIDKDAFFNCSNLKKISFEKSPTGLSFETGNYHSFYLNNIENIELMRSVNNSREIKEGPNSLTTYEIFDGLKSLKIGDDVSMVDFLFSFTYLPDSLEIGRNVKFPQKFGYRSSYDYDRKEDRRPDFSYIYDMRSIKLTESEPSFWPTFTNRQYMTIKVYVPEGSLNNYVNAESWENFWHIVEYVKTDSGIDSIRKDENNDLPRFFNLSGIEIPSNQLAPGIYIRRQGTKVSKVVIK